MTKTGPAPLAATYKRDLRLAWLNPRTDVAPNGATRALFDPVYKDVAPTELGRAIVKVDPWASAASSPLIQANPNLTFVNSVSLW